MNAGPLQYHYNRKYVDTIKFAPEFLRYEYEIIINFEGIAGKLPAISFQQKIAPINDTIFQVTGSGILGRTIHFNTVLNGVPSDTQFWMYSQDEDLYLKLMNTRSQTDRFNAEMVVTDIDHDSEFDIVFSFTGENNGKQTNIETNLSLKIIDSSIPSYILIIMIIMSFSCFSC